MLPIQLRTPLMPPMFNSNGINQFKDQLREFFSHKLDMLSITLLSTFKLRVMVKVKEAAKEPQLREFMLLPQSHIKPLLTVHLSSLIQTREPPSMLKPKEKVMREAAKEPQLKEFMLLPQSHTKLLPMAHLSSLIQIREPPSMLKATSTNKITSGELITLLKILLERRDILKKFMTSLSLSLEIITINQAWLKRMMLLTQE